MKLQRIYLIIVALAVVITALSLLRELSPTATIKVAHKEKYYSIIGNDIFLTRTIGPPNEYAGLVQFIATNKHVSDMNVYLVGNGGIVESTSMLLGVMEASPTKFHAIVIGNVYSAHATLAMNMDTLSIADPNAIFLFHRIANSTILGTAVLLPEKCKGIPEEIEDRSISLKLKCEQFAEVYEKAFNKSYMEMPFQYMTREERRAYEQGHDVLIIDMLKRIKERDKE